MIPMCDNDKADQALMPFFDPTILIPKINRILCHGWGRVEIVIKDGAIDAVYCTEIHRNLDK